MYNTFDLYPDQQQVINNLLNDIVSAHETHLTTGIVSFTVITHLLPFDWYQIGTKYLMELLHWLDRDDIALQLAENVDYPSWGYMVGESRVDSNNRYLGC